MESEAGLSCAPVLPTMRAIELRFVLFGALVPIPVIPTAVGLRSIPVGGLLVPRLSHG